jgi:hypothetical protein
MEVSSLMAGSHFSYSYIALIRSLAPVLFIASLSSRSLFHLYDQTRPDQTRPAALTTHRQALTHQAAQYTSMVKHQIFGVERDIDIPADVFPTANELQEFDDLFAGVNTEHGWFDSCYGGAKLHYQKWLPGAAGGTKPKAIIIYMHGIQSNAVKGFTLEGGSGRKVNTPLLVDGT